MDHDEPGPEGNHTSMSNREYRLTILGLALVLALTGTAGLASELSDGAERILDGHSFTPSNYIDDPFVSTTLANNVGGGMAVNTARPFYDLDGNLLFTYEGSIFFAALGLDFQQNLWETWAVRVAVEGLARAGTNMESILSEGATVDTDFAISLKKRLIRSERAQVSLGLDWGYSSTTIFSLRSFAEHIGSGGSLETAPLTSDNKIWKTLLSANTAYALAPGWGVRFNARGGIFEEPDFSNVSKAIYELNGMVDLDLKARTKVPLGLSLGYKWGSPSDNPHSGMSAALFGVWYTGKPDFTIGTEIGWWQRPVRNSEQDSDGVIALITLRYWF